MFMRVINTGSQPGNCYALKSESGETLLLDCGCRYSEILKGISYRISEVSGCLLTHGHGDHLKSFQNLMQSGIQIYTNDETVESVNTISGELMIGLPEKKSKDIGSFRVTPFYVPHDKTSNFAYMISHEECGRIIYATDFSYLPFTFKNMRINHFLIECNHLDESPEQDSFKFEHSIRGHSSLSTVKEIIRVNKTASLRTITLCHLSEGWGNPEVMQKEIQDVAGDDVLVQIARPGLDIDLNLCPF